MAFIQWNVRFWGMVLTALMVATTPVGLAVAAGSPIGAPISIPLRTLSPAPAAKSPLVKEAPIAWRGLSKPNITSTAPSAPVVVMPAWRALQPAAQPMPAKPDPMPALRTLPATQVTSSYAPTEPMPELRTISPPSMPSPSFTTPSLVTMPPPPPQSSLQIVADSANQQLPAGTLLRLTFLNGLNSAISEVGEPFTAMLNSDLMGSRGELLLPKGTALRGRIDEVLPSRFFSRGGMISLAFDHVVLPTGQQLPITLQLSTDEQTGLVNKQGVLYTDPGVVSKLSNSVNQGTELFYKVAQVGFSSGKDIGNGWGQLVTVPVAAVGGAVAGAGVAAGKGAYSLVAKGADVTLAPDQQVLVRLSQPTTFPVAD
jgi:hypothetical protein